MLATWICSLHLPSFLYSRLCIPPNSVVPVPSGPLASVACAKLGNRVTSIMGALLVTAGFLISIFANSLIYLYISMGLVVGES